MVSLGNVAAAVAAFRAFQRVERESYGSSHVLTRDLQVHTQSVLLMTAAGLAGLYWKVGSISFRKVATLKVGLIWSTKLENSKVALTPSHREGWCERQSPQLFSGQLMGPGIVILDEIGSRSSHHLVTKGLMNAGAWGPEPALEFRQTHWCCEDAIFTRHPSRTLSSCL